MQVNIYDQLLTQINRSWDGEGRYPEASLADDKKAGKADLEKLWHSTNLENKHSKIARFELTWYVQKKSW